MQTAIRATAALATVAFLAAGCSGGPGPTGPGPEEGCQDTADCVPSPAGGVTANIQGGFGTVQFSALRSEEGGLQFIDSGYVAAHTPGNYVMTAVHIVDRSDQLLEGHILGFVLAETTTPRTLAVVADNGQPPAPGEAQFGYAYFLGDLNGAVDISGTIVLTEATAARLRGTFAVSGQLEDGSTFVIEEGVFDCPVTDQGG